MFRIDLFTLLQGYNKLDYAGCRFKSAIQNRKYKISVIIYFG